MNKNLLILGTGRYGTVAKEIAVETGCFDRVDFLDITFGHGETEVNCNECILGKFEDYSEFVAGYAYAICAVSDPEIRKIWTAKLTEAHYRIPVLVSPRAYVSKRAQLSCGDIIEPFAVVSAEAAVGISVFISAGAILNYGSYVSDYCHIDSNAVVMSGVTVTPGTETQPCEVLKANISSSAADKVSAADTDTVTVGNEFRPIAPVGIYNFDDVM